MMGIKVLRRTRLRLMSVLTTFFVAFWRFRTPRARAPLHGLLVDLTPTLQKIKYFEVRN